MRPVTDYGHDLLQASLEVAVPLRIEELRDMAAEERAQLGKAQKYVLASQGDLILYRSTRKGETSTAFNALVTALAALAYAPGGVKFAGHHWEAAP